MADQLFVFLQEWLRTHKQFRHHDLFISRGLRRAVCRAAGRPPRAQDDRAYARGDRHALRMRRASCSAASLNPLALFIVGSSSAHCGIAWARPWRAAWHGMARCPGAYWRARRRRPSPSPAASAVLLPPPTPVRASAARACAGAFAQCATTAFALLVRAG